MSPFSDAAFTHRQVPATARSLPPSQTRDAFRFAFTNTFSDSLSIWTSGACRFRQAATAPAHDRGPGQNQ
jgi:hypothetical protein